MGKSASVGAATAAAGEVVNEPIRKAPEDAFARAVECAGGEKAMAERSGLMASYVHAIIWEGVLLEADLCPAVERAARLKVSCEALRPDLIWHRDTTGEVAGYSCSIDLPKEVLAAVLAKPGTEAPLVEGQWDALSYRAGMLHGVPQVECERLLNGAYAPVRDWSDPEMLDSLLADIDNYRSDGVFHQCYGMLWDLEEKDRDSLLTESEVNLSRDWTPAKTEELWAKAQAIRAQHPEKSSIAGRALAFGMASVAETAQEIEALMTFHGVNNDKTWTAEAYDDLSEHTRAVVLKSLLRIEPDDIPDWRDILLGQSYGTRSLLDGEDAGRKSQAAMNLLDQVLPGIAAIHDVQWVAMDSPNADCIDKRSHRNIAVFLKSMQELVQLLVNLRDNMLFRQRQLEG